MLHTFWGTTHPPISIHSSICSSIYPGCRGLPPSRQVPSPMLALVAQGESFITIHLEIPDLQETLSTLGMRRAGHEMMQTCKQV